MNRSKTALIILLFTALLLPACKGGCPLIKRDMPLQPSADSVEKFKAISKWIPESADTVVAVDVYKIVNTPVWEKISDKGTSSFVKYFKAPGLNFTSDIGMLAVVADIEPGSQSKGPVLLIQGGFHQDLILSRIKDQALKDNLKLTESEYNKTKIFISSSDEDESSQAFAAIDDGLIAIAKPDNLKWLIDSKLKKSKNPVIGDVPIWGRMTVDKKLAEAIPAPWNGIQAIELAADIDEDINAQITIRLNENAEPQRLRTALDGLKAIEVIRLMDNKDMMNAIEKISIAAKESTIIIHIPEDIGLLTKIYAKEEKENEEPKDDIAVPDVDDSGDRMRIEPGNTDNS